MFKSWFVKFLGILNTIEGISHLVVTAIGLWGCISLNVYDPRILTPVVENFVFGIFSIATGLVMTNLKIA